MHGRRPRPNNTSLCSKKALGLVGIFAVVVVTLYHIGSGPQVRVEEGEVGEAVAVGGGRQQQQQGGQPSGGQPQGGQQQQQQQEQPAIGGGAGGSAIPPAVVREPHDVFLEVNGNKMHMVVGGAAVSGRPSIVLVHGGNPSLQNAAFWEPHYEFLGRMGRFYALDLLGHGQSASGRFSRDEKYDCIGVAVAHAKAENPEAPLVLLGRSFGGGLTLDFLYNDMAGDVDKTILTAPASPSSRSTTKLKPPALIFWDTDDPVMPYKMLPSVESRFETYTTHVFHGLGTHTPEIVVNDEWEAAIAAFLKQ